MIVGEQRLSENNYYSESSNQLDGLKRKLSSENENKILKNNSYNNKIFNSNNKMHFIENHNMDTYNTYQSNEQIHQQDGDQSYINLTVLTPALIQYDKVQIDCRPNEESQNFNQISNISNSLIKSKVQESNVAKYEVKNYQQHHHHHQSGIIGKFFSQKINYKHEN